MLLTNKVKKRLSARQIAALQRIDDEDFSGVRRKVAEEFKKQGRVVDDAYLDAGIFALKLYYALPVVDPLNMHAVSDELDPFWHMHILHTKQYAAFCEETVGTFMHHDPLDHAQATAVAQVRFLYGYTVTVLEWNPGRYPTLTPVCNPDSLIIHGSYPSRDTSNVYNAISYPATRS